MNDFEELCRVVTDELPGSTIAIDRPASDDAAWWADVEWNGRHATVEWRPEVGFGLSQSGGGYGEGPDRVVKTQASAVQGLVELLGAPAAAKIRA